MKVWICYEIKNGPWGGGNQFLKALSRQLSDEGILATSASEADVILFNSHQNLYDVLLYKSKYPNKRFIHRVDGPVGVTRNDGFVDHYIFQFNERIADATVFQSDWSRLACLRMGLAAPTYEKTILNAPDDSIFYRCDDKKEEYRKDSNVIRIVATSWSTGVNKGYHIYEWLDRHLDDKKYSFTFIGRWKDHFNVKNKKPPLESQQLAKQLRSHDIYVTASHNDPCSNSLIEAMHCGLPALALNSGGHPEIVGSGGLLFSEKEEILSCLEKMSRSIDNYRRAIDLPYIKEVADQYIELIKSSLKRPHKAPLTRSERRVMIKLVDRHHDRGKIRPLKKFRRRAALWL